MKHVEPLAIAILLIPLAPVAVMVWDGCASTYDATQATNVGIYGTELHGCIVDAGTRAQAEACMAEVRAEWCGQGGAWAGTPQCTREGGL